MWHCFTVWSEAWSLLTIVVDFRLFLPAVVKHNIAGTIYFAIVCVVLQSQPIQISNRLSRNLARMGAEAKRADPTCPMARQQGRRG